MGALSQTWGGHSNISSDVPAASTIHVKLRADHTLLQHVRPLELLAIYELPIMLCHGVRRVRAQISSLSVWVPVVQSGVFGVPTVLEGRKGIVRGTGIRGYDSLS